MAHRRRRVTIWRVNDRIRVRPITRELDPGEEIIFEIDAESDDTEVKIGDFTEVAPGDFRDPPTSISDKKPFDKDPLSRIGPGEIASGLAKDIGRYKYTVTWEKKGEKPIQEDPWFII